MREPGRFSQKNGPAEQGHRRETSQYAETERRIRYVPTQTLNSGIAIQAIQHWRELADELSRNLNSSDKSRSSDTPSCSVNL